MKKWWWLMVVVLLLVACNNTSDEEPIDDVSTFTGSIKSLQGDDAIIDAAVGGGRMDIAINVSNYNETFAVGDVVTVEYTGGIRESHPAQVNVVSVTKQ